MSSRERSWRPPASRRLSSPSPPPWAKAALTGRERRARPPARGRARARAAEALAGGLERLHTQRRPRGPRCVTEERSYMQRLESRLDGPILIAPRVIGDERGFFCETYRRSVYAELGIA